MFSATDFLHGLKLISTISDQVDHPIGSFPIRRKLTPRLGWVIYFGLSKDKVLDFDLARANFAVVKSGYGLLICQGAEVCLDFSFIEEVKVDSESFRGTSSKFLTPRVIPPR